MAVTPVFTKDPSAVLDYSLDWTLWLGDAETIASSSWTVDAGLTKDSQSHTATESTVWVSGGTPGADYTLVCTVTTNQGRTDQRSILLRCRER